MPNRMDSMNATKKFLFSDGDEMLGNTKSNAMKAIAGALKAATAAMRLQSSALIFTCTHPRSTTSRSGPCR